jgi:hypothetical protein
VYHGQKVHLFRPSLSFLPRRSRGLKIGGGKEHFLADVHMNFFKTTKQKTSLEKLQIYFFIVCTCYQLAKKTSNLLVARQ